MERATPIRTIIRMVDVFSSFPPLANGIYQLQPRLLRTCLPSWSLLSPTLPRSLESLQLRFFKLLIPHLWQVVLRWGVQRGYSVIPKSENPERMAANLAVEGFSLREEDMAAVNSLERGFRFNDPGHFCPLAFSTQCPIWD